MTPALPPQAWQGAAGAGRKGPSQASLRSRVAHLSACSARCLEDVDVHLGQDRRRARSRPGELEAAAPPAVAEPVVEQAGVGSERTA